MATPTSAPSGLPVSLRLRGRDPMIEVLASNLSINLGEATGSNATLTVREGPLLSSPALWHLFRDATAPSQAVTALCATDLTAELQPTEPALSLRTWSDGASERARVGPDGLSCAALTAGSYCNLVQDYAVRSAVVPPSAAALNDAVEYMSSAALTLQNDRYLRSQPDNVPRLLLATDGATITAAPDVAASGGAAAATRAFAWQVGACNSDGGGGFSNPAVDAMTLGCAGELWVGSSIAIGGGAASNQAGPLLTAGGGCNLGLNLPAGTSPACALHVHGAVCADETMYMLSDARVKADVRPLDRALEKIMCIRGCTYTRVDIPVQRQIGVIAQDVQAVLPEAVHVDGDGRLSVAYGNLIAVAIEAIRELVCTVQDLSRQQAALLAAVKERPPDASSSSYRHGSENCARQRLEGGGAGDG